MHRNPEYLIERGTTYVWLSERQWRTACRWARNANMELPKRVPRRTPTQSVATRLVRAAVLIRRRLAGQYVRCMEYR